MRKGHLKDEEKPAMQISRGKNIVEAVSAKALRWE